MRKKAIISILILSFAIGRQQFSLVLFMGFIFLEGKSKQVIPFKKYNNLMVFIKINDTMRAKPFIYLVPTHKFNITIVKSFEGDINGYLGRGCL